MKGRRVTAVVLAYGREPHLRDCIDALLASRDVDLDIVLVDNGANPVSMDLVRARPRVQVVVPRSNLGYAGGCNLGGHIASAPVLAFVNSDALVDPHCLAALADSVAEPRVGLAAASVRLADNPGVLNSAGNPVHFLGFSWAGSYGEPADLHRTPGPVASVSGATFAVRRDVWTQLGGFDDVYFAYGEDVDLSIRCWERGYRVEFVPQAVSLHFYEFSRNPLKHYLVERNRLVNMLTLFEPSTTRWMVAASLPVELGLLLVAARDGWSAQKIEGWRWLLRNRDYLRSRRASVQASRVASDREIASLLRGHLDPPQGFGVSVPRFVDTVLTVYWGAARRRLDRRGARRSPR